MSTLADEASPSPSPDLAVLLAFALSIVYAPLPDCTRYISFYLNTQCSLNPSSGVVIIHRSFGLATRGANRTYLLTLVKVYRERERFVGENLDHLFPPS